MFFVFYAKMQLIYILCKVESHFDIFWFIIIYRTIKVHLPS